MWVVVELNFLQTSKRKKNPDNNSSDKSKAFELTSRLFNPESRTHSLKWSASCRKEAPHRPICGSALIAAPSRYEIGGGARRNHATWSKNKSAVSALRRGPHQLRLLLHDIFISYLDPPIAALFCTKYLGIVHAQIKNLN
jgi:hypothetical protein